MKALDIVFRLDSSQLIGTGHVVRCLALARQLKKNGHSVRFVVRALEGAWYQPLKDDGFEVLMLPGRDDGSWLGTDELTDAKDTQEVLKKPVDLIWIDHYGLHQTWETKMRSWTKKIAVLDDFTPRIHDCDLFMDCSFRTVPDHALDQRVPHTCIRLLGPQFVLLREEFLKARKKLKRSCHEIRHALVFFGGVDRTNETGKFLRAMLETHLEMVTWHIVATKSNPQIEALKEMAAKQKFIELHEGVTNMAELMAQCDLAVGAGGGSVFERACLGLPSIVISVASNQTPGCQALAQKGYHLFLGEGNRLTGYELVSKVLECVQAPELLFRMGEKSMELTQGEGVTLVAQALEKLFVKA